MIIYWALILSLGRETFASHHAYPPRRTSSTPPVSREEVAAIYKDVFSSYAVFPPITDSYTVWQDPNLTRPIEVAIGTVFTSIDTIDPGNSEFSVSSRSMMYWKRDDCNQTIVHQDACRRNLGRGSDNDGFKFLRSENDAGGGTTRLLNVPNIHSQVFADRGLQELQPDADIFEQYQVTFKQTFDMRLYPFEYHELDVSYTSAYSSNIVALTDLPGVDAGMLNPSVPAGWTLEGISCESGMPSSEGRAMAEITGFDIPFATYRCIIAVSRTNQGWWLTSFLLFASLLAIAFLGSLGILSRYVAEARDDRDAARRAIYDGTRLEGTFAVGLLLVYVFQVEISPYGQPIEYWPRIPTSTMIYILGMLAIMAATGAGLFCSLVFTRPLMAEGFVGGLILPYDIDKLPKEGEVPEEEMPLIVNGADNVDDDSEKGAAVHPDDESPQAPETASAKENEIVKARKCNQKMYSVLSVEEAAIVNRFARRTFFFKVGLISIVAVVALIILVVAHSNYKGLVSSAPGQ